MPMTHYICPDGEQIPIPDCLQHCRMGKRCLTRPTLLAILLSERPTIGEASVTRLLNGTMLEYLKHKHDYAISPRDRAFALLGSNHHSLLASLAGLDAIAEERQQGMVAGTPDLLDPDEEQPGSYVLTDYKTYGSYRVAKILGLVGDKTWRTGRDGKRYSQTTWRIDPLQRDIYSEQLQLNCYRILFQNRGYKISRMQLQITVRDGGVAMAKQRGITELIYLVDIPPLSDGWVANFFQDKLQQLQHALNTNTIPQPCNERESWEGRRCLDYCEVAQFCPQGIFLKQKQAAKASS